MGVALEMGVGDVQFKLQTRKISFCCEDFNPSHRHRREEELTCFMVAWSVMHRFLG